MNYKCLRCDYENSRIDTLKRHFTRKNLCKPIITNASVEQCLRSLKDIRFTNEILKKEITKLKLENKDFIIEKQEEQLKKQEEQIKNLLCELNIENDDCNEDDCEYIYLLKEREFIKTKENIYKIGRTFTLKNRMKQYPKNSKIIIVQPCIDCITVEKELLEIFKNKYLKTDIGTEYFKGDAMDMVKTINNYFNDNA